MHDTWIFHDTEQSQILFVPEMKNGLRNNAVERTPQTGHSEGEGFPSPALGCRATPRSLI